MRSSPKILLVDDDDNFCEALSLVLCQKGYEVLRATDGKTGLDLAKKHLPALIILDVMMTERTEGFFTLHNLRTVPELKSTPVIMVSSVYHDHPEIGVEPDKSWLPCDLFLKKPVSTERLLAEIKNRLKGQETFPKSPT